MAEMSKELKVFLQEGDQETQIDKSYEYMVQLVMNFPEQDLIYGSKCLLWEAPGMPTDQLAEILAKRVVSEFSSSYLSKVNLYLSEKCQLSLFSYRDRSAKPAKEASKELEQCSDPVFLFCKEAALTELNLVSRYLTVSSVEQVGQLSNIASVLLEIIDEADEEELPSWLIDLPKRLQQRLLDAGLLEHLAGEVIIRKPYSVWNGFLSKIGIPTFSSDLPLALHLRVYVDPSWIDQVSVLEAGGGVEEPHETVS